MTRRRRRAVRLFLAALLGFVALNVVADRHADRLTRYSPAAANPTRPEDMILGDKLTVAFTGVAVPRPTTFATPGLPFTSHTLPVGDEHLALWHIDHPSPRGVVVLGHGYMSCKAGLIFEAEAFHRLGFACVLLDFRGHADSSGDTTTLGVAEAADLAAAARWAQAQHPGKPLVLYGFSMGSAAVLKAVADHGVEPTAVVLEAPFDRLLNAVRVRFRALGAPAWPGAELVAFWGGRRRGFDAFAHNPADDAARIRCPALVLHGTADARATPDMVAAVYARLPDLKRLVSFDGAGHQSLVRFDRAKWEAAVGECLGR